MVDKPRSGLDLEGDAPDVYCRWIAWLFTEPANVDAFRADPVGATRLAPIDAAPADLDRLAKAIASVTSRGYERR